MLSGARRLAALEGLRHKYRELHDMRCERERLEGEGVMRFAGEALTARSARGRALAQRFPGVLRELDHCDAATLAARLRDIDLELRDGSAAGQRWIDVMLDFHALWRDGLAIRAWLRAHRHDAARADEAMVVELRRHLAADAEVTLAPESIDAPLLMAHFALGRGSLASWIWAEIARRHKISIAEARQLLFPG